MHYICGRATVGTKSVLGYRRQTPSAPNDAQHGSERVDATATSRFFPPIPHSLPVAAVRQHIQLAFSRYMDEEDEKFIARLESDIQAYGHIRR